MKCDFCYDFLVKNEISKPPNENTSINYTKKFVFLPVRADLLYILHYETPCTIVLVTTKEK